MDRDERLRGRFIPGRMPRRAILMGLGVSAVALLPGVAPAPAGAQVALGVAATTDVRLRGLSLNGGRPALTASLAYDHPSGLYAGAAATAGDTRRSGVRLLNYIANLGYARRLDAGLAADVGAIHTQVYSNVDRRFSGSYTEVYAGLSSELFSARLFYAPSFFVRGFDAIYVDVNANLRPAARLRLFGHGGLLVPLGAGGAGIVPRTRYDTRFGIAAERGRGELQLAWVRSGAGPAFLAPRGQSPDAIIVGASLFF
jgi:uncharacterized protein (TIGR02001 family)